MSDNMNQQLRDMQGFFITDVIVLDDKFTLVLEQETADGTVVKTVDVNDAGTSFIKTITIVGE